MMNKGGNDGFNNNSTASLEELLKKLNRTDWTISILAIGLLQAVLNIYKAYQIKIKTIKKINKVTPEELEEFNKWLDNLKGVVFFITVYISLSFILINSNNLEDKLYYHGNEKNNEDVYQAYRDVWSSVIILIGVLIGGPGNPET